MESRTFERLKLKIIRPTDIAAIITPAMANLTSRGWPQRFAGLILLLALCLASCYARNLQLAAVDDLDNDNGAVVAREPEGQSPARTSSGYWLEPSREVPYSKSLT